MRKLISLILTLAIFIVAATSSVGADSSKENNVTTSFLTAGITNTDIGKEVNVAPPIPDEGITKEYLTEFSNSFTIEYLKENPEFAAALEELKKILKTDETDVKIIEEQLLQTEAIKTLALKIGDNETIVRAVMDSPESKEQLKRIDALAQEYYDQYKLTGVLPETESPETVTLAAASEDREYGNDYVYSVNTGDAVIALSTAGVIETEARLATRLVTLGTLSALDGPLPVADIICLVVGISLLWSYTAKKLSTNSTAVTNQIGTYYGTTVKSTAQGVIFGAATITARVRQGWNHFVAFRVNTPPGGITLGNNLTFAAASSHLKASGDVWSIQKSTAKTLAANISFVTGPSEDPAHTSGGMIMNRPHWHATVMGVRTGGHSFW